MQIRNYVASPRLAAARADRVNWIPCCIVPKIGEVLERDGYGPKGPHGRVHVGFVSIRMKLASYWVCIPKAVQKAISIALLHARKQDSEQPSELTRFGSRSNAWLLWQRQLGPHTMRRLPSPSGPSSEQ